VNCEGIDDDKLDAQVHGELKIGQRAELDLGLIAHIPYLKDLDEE
jgi:hypothetical protein